MKFKNRDSNYDEDDDYNEDDNEFNDVFMYIIQVYRNESDDDD